MADENLTSEAAAALSQMEEQAKRDAEPPYKASENTASAPGAFGEAAGGDAKEAMDNAKHGARTLRENADQYVRDNPTKAVLTALGIGFVCGLIFRR